VRARVLIVPFLLAVPFARAQSHPGEDGPSGSFEEIASRAAEAWSANRLAEAARLYGDAVERRPDWDEGWWYLGSALYTEKRWEEGRAALRRFLEIKPGAGPGWALLGLCEFEIGDLAAARGSLQRALDRSETLNRELYRAAQLHLALAFVRDGQFERALAPLTWLARAEPETPGLEIAIGLSFLRMPLLPSEVPESRRELVAKAGRAGFLNLATREEEAEAAYAALVESYPNEPWVHYAQGAFLKKRDTDRALAAFRRELAVLPDNVYAHLEIAFELLVRGDAPGALEAATSAVRLAPGLFASHHVLGRALVQLGRVDEGILELEEAARLAPDVPEMHFALQRAYGVAGRTQDMERARTRFAELERERRARLRSDRPPVAEAEP
jgi:tetratricopeptide (TPR) repeat protein